MDGVRPGALDRTVKLDIDEGRARSVADAERMAGEYVLRIDAGADAAASETHQAALLTAVNAGARAFRGGVEVGLREDGPALAPWAEGEPLSAAVRRFGGAIVRRPSPGLPALLIGDAPAAAPARVALHATWQGWSGGVTPDPDLRLPETDGFPLAGALAGALGVSEAFQHVRGSGIAGRREAGLSLWRPDLGWRGEDAWGPPCEYLPLRVWLLGLGHLGQAYAWALAMAPSTAYAVLRRAGLHRRDRMHRVSREVVRYERDRPGELLHLDVKKLGRVPPGGGKRFSPGFAETRSGPRGKGGGGLDCVHVAVDDHSRYAYAEALPDERGVTTAAFLERAIAFFADLGVRVERVITDNGANYLSGAFRGTAAALGVGLRRTRPYRPQTNGKAEAFIKILQNEWAYGRLYTSNAERLADLPVFLLEYNHARPHGGIDGVVPASRL